MIIVIYVKFGLRLVGSKIFRKASCFPDRPSGERIAAIVCVRATVWLSHAHTDSSGSSSSSS